MEQLMIDAKMTPEFQRGWDAAILAVRRWHEAQASKAMVQAKRGRLPRHACKEGNPSP
jgi:hypothetical protein